MPTQPVRITLTPNGAQPDSAIAYPGDTIIWTPTGNNRITSIAFNNPNIFSQLPAPASGNQWQGVLSSNAAHGKQKYSFVAGGILVDPDLDVKPPR
jgi:hypothetical protein